MADAPLITAFELRAIARDIADTDTPAWLIGVLNRAARTADYWQGVVKQGAEISHSLESLRVAAVETVHALEAGEQRTLIVAPQFAIALCDRVEMLEAENDELRDRWRSCVDTIDVMRSALTHRSAWSGTKCSCGLDPCPGFPDEAVSLPVEEQPELLGLVHEHWSGSDRGDCPQCEALYGPVEESQQ